MGLPNRTECDRGGWEINPNSSLVIPSARLLYESARFIDINYQDSGVTKRWEPNKEQITTWLIGEHALLEYVLKTRQVGISTSELLKDAMFAAINSANGNPVNVWLVWNKDPVCIEKLLIISNFLRTLGIEHIYTKTQISLAVVGRDTRSYIQAYAANGRRAGAGSTAHRIHMSETPAYNDAEATFISIQSALVGAGNSVVETTMLLGQDQPRTLWERPSRWAKVFFGVEAHAEYRRPEENFKPDDPDLPESLLRAWGMTDRGAMAFMQEVFRERCAGDIYRLGREFPPTPEVCFQSAKGRWVRNTPNEIEHRRQTATPCGEKVRIFVEPGDIWREDKDFVPRIVAGVDTAGSGSRGDSSAIGVIDRVTGRLLATYKSREVETDVLAAVAKHLYDFYTAPARIDRWTREQIGNTAPRVIIEANGIGGTTCDMARKLGLPHIRYDAKGGTTYAVMLAVKRRVQHGALYGCPDLAKECDSVAYVKEKWHGRKDLLCALGFAARDIEANPYVPPAPRPNPNLYQRAPVQPARKVRL